MGNQLIRLKNLILRKLANICIFPKLRIFLFKKSGLVIGKDTFINTGLICIDNYRGKGSISIGERVSIANNIILIADSDPNESKISEIDDFYIRGFIKIQDDVWIGAGAIILPNIVIGEKSIIGAGSVVTKNVEPMSIVAGNPARLIRRLDGE